MFQKTAEALEGKLLIGQVNLDDEKALGEAFDVKAIPTFLFFRDGQPGERLVEPGSKAELDDWLKRQLGE